MIRQVLNWIVFLIAVLIFLFLVREIASAQACSTAPKIKDVLEGYGESPIYEATGKNGVVLEFFVNHLSKTWSVITIQPNGLSCLIGSGEGFVELNRGNL